jgi:hypothetical protein
MKNSLRLTMLAALISGATLAMAGGVRPDVQHEWKPTGRGTAEVDEAAEAAKAAGQAGPTGQATPTGYGIVYHGGPVMSNATGNNLYVIWYGNWAAQNPTAPAIITDFLSHLGGTPYFNINTTYSDSAGAKVVNALTLAGQAFVSSTGSTYSKRLSDANIKTLVSNAITGGTLPKDPNAVYLVLTSKDVNATSGFCTRYCGWHTAATIGGADIKYSFVGDAARCPTGCAAQSTVSPNNNVGADGMISVIAHEIEEAASDPDLNAWYDTAGNENGDKCAWNFGTTSTLPSGAKYNQTMGTRNYLIQQNWVNVAPAGLCAKSYP